MRVAVVGGGPSGLTVAWELRRLARTSGVPLELRLFERLPRPGGKMWTESINGYQVEHGPEAVLNKSPHTLRLADELGIGDSVVSAAPEARNRYIFADSKLHRVPTNPVAALRSPILSMKGRLRLLCEPFARRGSNVDESVTTFASRRLGSEGAHRLVGSMVSGIHAGDPSQLSMPAAFPNLSRLEQRYGSLTRAMVAQRWKNRNSGRATGGPAGPSGRLTAFRGGMKELAVALSKSLGDDVRYDCPVEEVHRSNGTWEVTAGHAQENPFDHVIIATEPWHAASLLRNVDQPLAAALDGIPSTPVAAVALGFEAEALPQNLDGFGFLTPRGEGMRILGCQWSSASFPHRAPSGHVLLRALIGGALDPSALELDDEKMIQVVLSDLGKAMHIVGAPDMVRVIRHAQALPQYTLGHGTRLDMINGRIESLGGLSLHGNGYHGISLNDCVGNATAVAQAALRIQR